MITVRVWILIIFGVVACGEYCEDNKRPMVVIDDLASREQCVKVGQRLAGRTSTGSYECLGVDKVALGKRSD